MYLSTDDNTTAHALGMRHREICCPSSPGLQKYFVHFNVHCCALGIANILKVYILISHLHLICIAGDTFVGTLPRN